MNNLHIHIHNEHLISNIEAFIYASDYEHVASLIIAEGDKVTHPSNFLEIPYGDEITPLGMTKVQTFS